MMAIRDICTFVDKTAGTLGHNREALISILQAVQTEYNYLPEAALVHVSEVTDTSISDIVGVASFYAQFRLKPAGKHVIRMCHGTACHVKGSAFIEDALRRTLKIDGNSDTDPDNMFTIEPVACLGCCTIAPAFQIAGRNYGHLEPNKIPELIEEIRASVSAQSQGQNTSGWRRWDTNAGRHSNNRQEARIILDSCCRAIGTGEVADAVDRMVGRTSAAATVRPVSCSGLCHQSPVLEIAVPGKKTVTYSRVTPMQAEQIVRDHFRPSSPIGALRRAWSNVVDRLVEPSTDQPVIVEPPQPVGDSSPTDFIGRQVRVAMEDSGIFPPLSLDEYRGHRGFEAFQRARTMPGEDLVDMITKSGLRGRGGAGFPTGVKWGRVRAAANSPKYIICNGDEGDPGAFMDRMLLESFPYRVLEGMMIAAHAVGAQEGILYVRAEYPQAISAINEAIRRMQQADLLNCADNPLVLRVVQGAGAFVCGEETALIASLEGYRGMPHLRPPYPATKGFRNSPTLVNNVETYSLIPWIVRNGSEAFASIGTQSSKGTKVFSVSGKVARGGLVEVPMGSTIRQVVEEIAGGALPGRQFKAVLIGGPSGGCVPASLASTPIDYEALKQVGAMMGSGGLVVLDNTDCMVDIARYFLGFLHKESCGQCSSCRIGTQRIYEVLDRLCSGGGRPGDIEKLEELANHVSISSLCGLGQTAPNPVLTSLRYFRDEYQAHIEGRCPAGVCRALVSYTITDQCIGCTLCAQGCPVSAIPADPFRRHAINQNLCTQCDACRLICPEHAIEIVPRVKS
jgi:NADH-quinone oxidoreductase subunit F